jgi:hypothetical protein
VAIVYLTKVNAMCESRTGQAGAISSDHLKEMATAASGEVWAWLEERRLDDELYPRFIMPTEHEVLKFLHRILPICASNSSR